MPTSKRLKPKQRSVLFALLKRHPKATSMAGIALYLDTSANAVSLVFSALEGKQLAEQVGPSRKGDTLIRATSLARERYTTPSPGVRNPPGHYAP